MPECNDTDCNDTLRELELFLDQELSDGARQTIHSHLDGCPDCLQAFDFHAELKTVIAAKCHSDQMPAGLMAKIQNCFGTEFDADTTSESGSGASVG